MKNENARAWVLTFGILLIFSAGMFGMLWVIQNTIQKTVTPVQDTAGLVATRVAQVLNPTPTIRADPVTIIHGMQALARLETIQFTVEKVVTAENNQGPFGFLFGDRLVFVAHGVVVAGVDMGKLGPQDLWIEDEAVYVRLPEAEIFLSTLDNGKSYVYNRDTGILTHGDRNLETGARQAAEDAIRQAALEDGILRMANQNAETYLERLLRGLKFQEVIFVHDRSVSTPTPAPVP